MYTAITRILRAIHIIPAAKIDPVQRRPSGMKGEAPAPRPAGATVKAAPVTRDDTGREVRKVEPAMAVIPRDAVHMPPPVAASPGLPPVDPVMQPTAVASGDVTQPIGRPRGSRTKTNKEKNLGQSVRGSVQV